MLEAIAEVGLDECVKIASTWDNAVELFLQPESKRLMLRMDLQMKSLPSPRNPRHLDSIEGRKTAY